MLATFTTTVTTTMAGTATTATTTFTSSQPSAPLSHSELLARLAAAEAEVETLRARLDRVEEGVPPEPEPEPEPISGAGKWSACHSSVELSEDGTVAKKNGDRKDFGWSSAVCAGWVMSEGRHFVEFTIICQNYHMMCGVLPLDMAEVPVERVVGWCTQPRVHFLTSSGGSHFRNRTHAQWHGRAGFAAGDTVGMLLDCDRCTLSVFKNGGLLGEMVPGAGIPLGAGPWCWGVDLWDVGDSLRITRKDPPSQPEAQPRTETETEPEHQPEV